MSTRCQHDQRRVKEMADWQTNGIQVSRSKAQRKENFRNHESLIRIDLEYAFIPPCMYQKMANDYCEQKSNEVNAEISTAVGLAATNAISRFTVDDES